MSNLSQFLAGGGGKLRYQEFLSSGIFTPSSALLTNGGQCFVEAIGGGGSGGVSTNNAGSAFASGGDAGAYVDALVTVSGAVTVTLGAGGAAASRSGASVGTVNGNVGGDTTFGALLTAKGGLGGKADGGAAYAVGGKGASSLGYFTTDTTNTLSCRGGTGRNNKAGGGGGAGGASVALQEQHIRGSDGGGNGAAVSTGSVTAPSGAANSGAGGGAAAGFNANTGTITSGAGGSGWVRVSWFE